MRFTEPERSVTSSVPRSSDLNLLLALLVFYTSSLLLRPFNLACLCSWVAVQASQMSTGYASAVSHSFAEGDGCTATARRRSLPELLTSEQADKIGVVRISANGWEG